MLQEAIPNLLCKADTYIDSIPESRILGLVDQIALQNQEAPMGILDAALT
jgi:hypothetical protein